MHITFRTVLCLALVTVSLCGHADERGEALLKEVKQEALKVKTFVGKATLIMKLPDNSSKDMPLREMKYQAEVKIKFPNRYFIKMKAKLSANNLPSKVSNSLVEVWSISDGLQSYWYMVPMKSYTKEPATTTPKAESNVYLLLPSLVKINNAPTKVDYAGQEVVEGITYDLLNVEGPRTKSLLYISRERRVMRAKWFNRDVGMEVEEFVTEHKTGVNLPDSLFTFVPPKGATLQVIPDYTSELRPVNSIAPDFSLHLVDGADFNLNTTLKEKRVVLVCLSQASDFLIKSNMTDLQCLYDTYSKQGLTIVFHENRLSKEVVFKAMKQAGTTFPVAIKEDNTEASVLTQLAHPSQSAYYLIGANGKILYRTTSSSEDVLGEEIKKALK
jgi:outer membrane lipoprotein-sorting protein